MLPQNYCMISATRLQNCHFITNIQSQTAIVNTLSGKRYSILFTLTNKYYTHKECFFMLQNRQAYKFCKCNLLIYWCTILV